MTGNNGVFLDPSLLSVIGEWLLLLLSLWYLLSLGRLISNSWLLLIPGEISLNLSPLSTSLSSTVSNDEEEVVGLSLSESIGADDERFCEGKRIRDLTGDRAREKHLPGLNRLMKWWRRTINSNM